MNRGRRAFDALVVGGGTSGAAAAAFLAEAGLHTALVERRRLDDAGASWINAVPAWMFDRAGVEAPAPPERHGIFGRGSFRSPLDRASIDLEDVAAWDVDMRALGARLRRRAAAAGVHAFERTRVEDVQVAGGRVRALEVRGEESGPFRLEAALVVDASGRGGAVRRRVPELRRDCPQVGATDTCTAAASLHRIADVSGAQEFLARHRLRPGRAITWMGLAGGFSSLIVSMDEEVRSVSLVTGTVADGHHPSGPALLARALREHPWIGERISGGRGLIPLRRPFDRLCAPGVALVGDAACQVFSVHGSGVGNGLIAARLLADAVRGARDPGDEAVLWAYQARYQRERGAHSAAFDAFRKQSLRWKPEDVEALLDAGVLSPSMWARGLEQRLALPDGAAIGGALRGLLRRGRTLAATAPLVARMYAIHGIYRTYPEVPSRTRLKAWSRAAAAIAGVDPEIRD